MQLQAQLVFSSVGGDLAALGLIALLLKLWNLNGIACWKSLVAYCRECVLVGGLI